MIGNWRFVLVYVLLLGVGAFVYLHKTPEVPAAQPFGEFPMVQGEWRMITEERFSQNVLEVLKATDYLSRQYLGSDGDWVGLYVGYHSGGAESGVIHSPRHCLPGSGWSVESDGRIRLRIGEAEISAVKAIYSKGGRRSYFLYWFQVGRRMVTNEYALKLAEIGGALFENRRDSAFIRVSVPIEGDEEEALAVAKDFLEEFFPVIQSFLPR